MPNPTVQQRDPVTHTYIKRMCTHTHTHTHIHTFLVSHRPLRLLDAVHMCYLRPGALVPMSSSSCVSVLPCTRWHPTAAKPRSRPRARRPRDTVASLHILHLEQPRPGLSKAPGPAILTRGEVAPESHSLARGLWLLPVSQLASPRVAVILDRVRCLHSSKPTRCVKRYLVRI